MEGAWLGVGLDQGPGGAAAPSGGVQHLLPAGAQHLGVSGTWAGRPLRGRRALPLVLAPPGGRVRGPAGSRKPAGGRKPAGSRVPARGRGPGPRARLVLVGGLQGPPLLGGLPALRGCRGYRGRPLCGLGAGGRLRAGRAPLLARPLCGVPVNAGRGGLGPPGGCRSRGAGGALGDLGRPRPPGGTGGARVPACARPGPGGRAACPRSPASRGARCLSARGGLGGDQQTGHEQLQLEARRGGAHHLPQGLGGHVRRPGQAGGADGAGLDLHALQLPGRQGAQGWPGLLPGQGDDQQVPQPRQQVLHEPARVVPGGDHPVHHPEDPGPVGRRNSVHAGVQQGDVGVAQEGDGARVVHGALRRPAHELVHDRQGVTHAAAAGTHHQGEDPGPHAHALGGAQVAQVPLQDVGRHQAEGVVVGA